MKGSNSRLSWRAEARFSNLAQVQGGMVTDADLTEAGQIHQATAETGAGMALQSGVPAQGGMVSLAAALPVLREGLVVAGGKTGRFTMTSGAAALKVQMQAQVDLPLGPPLGDAAALLYADLWDRPVFAAEDPLLTDPGLHGAVTSYRTRTMVQVKALPLSGGTDPTAALAAMAAGSFPFLARGTAKARVKEADLTVAKDDCDPCATSVPVTQSLPNALFRLEVIDVTRGAGGGVSELVLAWSLENAEACEVVARLSDPTTREAFLRPAAAYEYLTPATEAQVGIFPTGPVVRPTLSADLSATPAAPPAGGTAETLLVRRWDGAGRVALSGAVTGKLGDSTVTVAGNEVTLNHAFFTLTLDLAGANAMAGDYWLVELRRNATGNDRMRLVGADAGGLAGPMGIEHRFCPLFVTQGNTTLPPPDALRRRISMPALSDLPATHVAYDPDCADWYGAGVRTVAGALNALCHLDAGKIAFTPPGDCNRFAGTSTVQGALERLCAVDDNSALTLVLRSMMDWGVVCGLELSMGREPGTINYSAGVALDPAGRIVSVPAGQIDLNADRIDGLDNLRRLRDPQGEVCLAFSFENKDKPTPHLTTKATAFGPADPTRQEAYDACIAGKKRLVDGMTLPALSKAESSLLQKVNVTWAKWPSLQGAVALSQEEEAGVNVILDGLVSDYATLISDTDAKAISDGFAVIDAEYATAGLSQAGADKRRMQRAAAKVAVLDIYERDHHAECACATGLTPCPPPAADPALVPVGCLTIEGSDRGNFSLLEVCNYCCRKQAMTWRSYRYYEPNFIQDAWNTLELKGNCCTHPLKPKPGSVDKDLGDKWRDPPIKYPFPGPQVKIPYTWPPRVEFVIPDPGNIDPVRPDYLKGLPKITDLSVTDAKDALIGTGFDVLGNVDLDGPGGFAGVLDTYGKDASPLRLDATPQPGDRVMMLTRGGKAVDYVTIGAGSGKLPFATPSDIAATEARLTQSVTAAIKTGTTVGAGPVVTAPDLGGVSAELQDLLAEKTALEAGVAALADTRETLAKDVEGLTRTMQDLAADQAKATTALNDLRVSQAQTQGAIDQSTATLNALRQSQALAQVSIDQSLATLTTLRTAQGEAQAGIDRSKAALDELQKAQTALIAETRGAMPIESLRLDPAATARLKAGGALTVKDLTALPQATVSAALRGTPVSPADVQAAVTRFTKPGF